MMPPIKNNGYWLKYSWCEGDHDQILIATELEQPEFEVLLAEGMTMINEYPDVGYNEDGSRTIEYSDREAKAFHVRCVPEAWEKLIIYLEQTGKCQAVYVQYDTYGVDDAWTENSRGFTVNRIEKQLPKRTDLLANTVAPKDITRL